MMHTGIDTESRSPLSRVRIELKVRPARCKRFGLPVRNASPRPMAVTTSLQEIAGQALTWPSAGEC